MSLACCRLSGAWVGRVVGPSRCGRGPSWVPRKSSGAPLLHHSSSLDTVRSGREAEPGPGIFFSKTQVFFLPRHLHTTAIMSKANASACRQNYHEECEANVNKQINMELYASYVYMSMAYYFDREDVALPGFHKFFKKSSDEEREHAEKFMTYQNKRGGRIVLQPVAKPTRDEWNSPLEAVTAALELEKTVNQTLLELHGISSRNGDPQLCDFLETEFLEEQVKSIKELAGFVTQLNRCGKGLGEFIFDKELQEA